MAALSTSVHLALVLIPPAALFQPDPAPLHHLTHGIWLSVAAEPTPALALHPQPGLSPPSQLAEIQLYPCSPQLCSSLLIPPQLPHHPSSSFWAVAEAVRTRPVGSSVSCSSEWAVPLASETMASESRVYHPHCLCGLGQPVDHSGLQYLMCRTEE